MGEECKYAADDVVTFRTLFRELGFEFESPTIIYQDNQPAIASANRDRSLGLKKRHMMVKVGKLSEYIDDQEVQLIWQTTVQMVADLGTKYHGTERFEMLRDMMNGYALVRASQAKKLLKLREINSID